ncbi:MAG: hypothetical protein IKA11_04840 [Clostridia bacterium]|nr:hypothetical protein [Clostridia bacterium]
MKFRTSRNSIIKWVISLVLVFAIILPFFSVTGVDAGRSGGNLIDDSMLTGKSFGDWEFSKTGITVSNGSVHFDESYSTGNPFLSLHKANSSAEIEVAIHAEFTAKITDMTDGQRFGFVYGIKGITGDVGDNGTTFIYLTPNGDGYAYGISTFKDGAEQVILSATPFTAKTDGNKIGVKVYSDGRISLALDGTIVYFLTEKDKTIAEGYVAFSSMGKKNWQGGKIDVTIFDITVRNEYYAKPETPLIAVADFDSDDFNANEWYLKSFRAGGDGIMTRGGVLEFDNAGQNSTFSPRYKYSNFEFYYDIFDVNNQVTVGSDGIKQLPSYWYRIEWGAEGTNVEGASSTYETAKHFIRFDADVNMPYKKDGTGLLDTENTDFGKRIGKTKMAFQVPGYSTSITVPEKYAFFNADFDTDTVVRVRLRLIDGVFSVAMKLKNEVSFVEILRYEYPMLIQPTGYITLRGEGNQNVKNENNPHGYMYYHRGTDFKLDNLQIINFDSAPKLVSVNFVSNRLTPFEDYDYRDPYTDDYLITNTGGKSSGN